MYKELIVNGQKYLLVHAGLGDYSPRKQNENYSLKNLVWDNENTKVQFAKIYKPGAENLEQEKDEPRKVCDAYK